MSNWGEDKDLLNQGRLLDAFRRYPGETQRWYACHCGVSQGYVAKLLKEIDRIAKERAKK